MKLYSGRTIIFLVILMSSFGSIAVSADESKSDFISHNATANEIVTKVAGVYKACNSYCDSGIVKTVFFMKDGKIIDEKPFTTAFVRANQFRFEYSFKQPIPGAKPMRHIVWAKGNEVRTWRDVQPEVEEHGSLARAIAGATGVSGGAAHTIPALLMPNEIGGRRITSLGQIKRIADAELDDVKCYRLQGKTKPHNDPVTLWISKDTLLIYRIDEAHQFPEFRTETITEYKPQLNSLVDEDKLAFNPPEE